MDEFQNLIQTKQNKGIETFFEKIREFDYGSEKKTGNLVLFIKIRLSYIREIIFNEFILREVSNVPSMEFLVPIVEPE